MIFLPFNILLSICSHVKKNSKNASSRFALIDGKIYHLIDLCNLALTLVLFSNLEFTILSFKLCEILSCLPDSVSLH